MAESQNFKELLLLLNDCLVEYLIVGGYAVMRYSEPRFTKDLDIWVGRSHQFQASLCGTRAFWGSSPPRRGHRRDIFRGSDHLPNRSSARREISHDYRPRNT